MPDSLRETEKFQVNLRGIIDLLSNHLYSSPNVYIRELLQNSVDAIAARRQIDADHVGAIELEVLQGNPTSPPTLMIRDDGIGLTEDEIRQFLATIGESSKRETVDRSDFIGQFGIGLLSAFLVCEEIVVVTRSARSPDSKTWQWKGRSDGTYEITQLNSDVAPGTEVYLRAKPGCKDFLEATFVCATARHFGRYLKPTIRVSENGQTHPINEQAPWEILRNGASPQTTDELLTIGRDVFATDFLDAIPIDLPDSGVTGVAYILPYKTTAAAKPQHQVYLKGMLLSESADNLLPDWTFFVRSLVNVTDLRPTAARESFYEDEQLAETRADLSAVIRRYLIDLAQKDANRFVALIQLHATAIRSLACNDDEAYRTFIDWLPFETSLGHMTLREVIETHGNRVDYVSRIDAFQQIAGVAAAQGICIVNCGYVYETELMEQLPRHFPQRTVHLVEPNDLVEQLSDLSLGESDRVHALRTVADRVLERFRCRADVKRFEPKSIATLYTSSDEANFLRSVEQSKEDAGDVWGDVLEGLVADRSQGATATLCFNFENTLIQRLAKLRPSQVLERSIEMLYVQALLLGHFPLGQEELSLLNGGLFELIELSLGDPGPNKD
jgi:molecular chaperone HtpG